MKITKIIEECQIAMTKALDNFEKEKNLKKKIPWDFEIENPVDVFAMNLKKKENRLLDDNEIYRAIEESYIPVLYINIRTGVIPIDKLKGVYAEELLNKLSEIFNKQFDTLHLCHMADSSEIFKESEYNKKLKEKFNNSNFNEIENGQIHKGVYYKTKDGKFIIKYSVGTKLDIK